MNGRSPVGIDEAVFSNVTAADSWGDGVLDVKGAFPFPLHPFRTLYKHAGQIVTTSTVFIVDPAGGNQCMEYPAVMAKSVHEYG